MQNKIMAYTTENSFIDIFDSYAIKRYPNDNNNINWELSKQEKFKSNHSFTFERLSDNSYKMPRFLTNLGSYYKICELLLRRILFSITIKDLCTQLDEIKRDLVTCGLNHKDIHPGNILFDEKTKTLKLIDFFWCDREGTENINKKYTNNDAVAIEKLKKELEQLSIPIINEINGIKEKFVSSVGHYYNDGSFVAPGITYHPIDIPLFEDVKFYHNNCVSEYELIKKHIPKNINKITDIGCSTCYFTFNLIRDFFLSSVNVFETDPAVVDLIHDIIKTFNLTNFFINGKFDDTSIINSDVTIWMNNHQWIDKAIGRIRATKCIKNVINNSKLTFFQTSGTESYGTAIVDYLRNKEEINKLLQESSKNSAITFINSTTKHGGVRHLFKIQNNLPISENFIINNKEINFKNTDIKIGVTCVINTKNRYHTTLPLTLQAVCNQTYKPKELLLFDDGEHKDLREDPVYSHIFSLLDFHNIKWRVLFSNGTGQVLNHSRSLTESKTEWVWRLDDDNVPEPNVLEKLVANIQPNVGAIGGLVIDTTKKMPLPSIASNKIEDIYLGMNEQWFLHPEGSKPKEVDHLYSSFLYRKSAAKYNTELSVIGHREETILTYEIKLKGFKNILDPTAKTWHYCNPQGGIRSDENNRVKNSLHDEHIFFRKMIEWGIKANDYSFLVLENGIGDHYAFKYWLPAYLKKNENKKHVFFVCYPDVFSDIPEIKLASIADAKMLMGNIDKYNVYKWMIDNRWEHSLTIAYKKMLDLPNIEREKRIKKGEGDTIIVSPYSQNPNHPKSYPYWNELILKIKELGFEIIQIGKNNEKLLNGVDDFKGDLKFKDIENLISGCQCWISVDNFLPHLCNCMENIVPGIVIFSVTDPKHYGYNYNLNILKSKKFLRPDQFGDWIKFKQDINTFDSPEELFKKIRERIGWNY